MSTIDTIKVQMQSLIDGANEKTGKEDKTLTDAVCSLSDGYMAKTCPSGTHIKYNLYKVSLSEAYTGKVTFNSSSTYNLDSVTLNGVPTAATSTTTGVATTTDLSGDVIVGTIHYKISDNNGLIVDGCGAMQDYSSFAGMPWTSSRDSISEIAIWDGVTHIGDRSFYRCINATKASIPLSVKSIGDSAFYRCDKLTEVIYKGTKAEWYALMEKTGTNNGLLSGASLIVCSDGTI